MRAFAIAGLLLLAGCGSPAPQVVETPAAERLTVPAAVAPLPSLPALEAVVESVADTSDRGMLNGVWELVSFDQNEPDGNVSHPYGDAPAGRLTLDEAGRMSMFMMKPGRVASVNSASAISTASPEDLRQIADGFMAYYGSFQVDDATKTLTLKVAACTIPAWTGSEQKRAYELSGDTLTLLTPATKLTWTRSLK